MQRFWISDMDQKRLLQLDGAWKSLPLDGDADILTFASHDLACDMVRGLMLRDEFVRVFQAPDWSEDTDRS